MKILLVASECTPFAKVGGLGDVIGAFPQGLVASGVEVSVMLPFYQPMLKMNTELVQVNGQDTFAIEFEGSTHTCEFHKTTLESGFIPLLLIKNEKYLSNGGIYLSDDAMASGDEEPRRFMFFCKAVCYLIECGILDFDIVHCHDWHTSFLLKLIKRNKLISKKVKTALSVHNVANVGKVSDPVLNREIDNSGSPHFLMAVGLDSADKIIPVSRNYAKELLRGEHCYGMESVVLRNKEKIVGITNGIDVKYFNPETDPFIVKNYSVDDWKDGKQHAKKELYSKLQWKDVDIENTFLLGFVGRIAAQKNIQLMVDTIMKISNSAIHFVFLGVGDKSLSLNLHELALKHNNRVKFINRFDEPLARLIYAGSDSFLIPSLYEPCGLTQMIAMRYGSLPVGRAVGGLADTIEDREGIQSGFLFERSTVEELEDVLLYVYDEWLNNRLEWNQSVERAMRLDFSWENAAGEYLKVYSQLLN